jgi:PilZ domain
MNRVAKIKLEDTPPRRVMVRGAASNPICPACSKAFVKCVRPQGIGDWLISLLCIHPFKCQLCGHRFRYFQLGARYVGVDDDRREYDRITLNFPLSISGDDIDAEGTMLDISIGGCTLTTDRQFAVGDIVSLALQISNETLPVIVEAAVVRNVRLNTVGIEFLSLEQYDKDRLQIFIRGLLRGPNRWTMKDQVFQDDHAPSLAAQRM